MMEWLDDRKLRGRLTVWYISIFYSDFKIQDKGLLAFPLLLKVPNAAAFTRIYCNSDNNVKIIPVFTARPCFLSLSIHIEPSGELLHVKYLQKPSRLGSRWPQSAVLVLIITLPALVVRYQWSADNNLNSGWTFYSLWIPDVILAGLVLVLVEVKAVSSCCHLVGVD